MQQQLLHIVYTTMTYARAAVLFQYKDVFSIVYMSLINLLAYIGLIYPILLTRSGWVVYEILFLSVCSVGFNRHPRPVAGPRHLMGMKPSQSLKDALAGFGDGDIAKLVYRDHIKLKHASRKRLADEIEAQPPIVSLRGNRVDQDQTSEPLSKALVAHLLEAHWHIVDQTITIMCLFDNPIEWTSISSFC